MTDERLLRRLCPQQTLRRIRLATLSLSGTKVSPKLVRQMFGVSQATAVRDVSAVRRALAE